MDLEVAFSLFVCPRPHPSRSILEVTASDRRHGESRASPLFRFLCLWIGPQMGSGEGCTCPLSSLLERDCGDPPNRLPPRFASGPVLNHPDFVGGIDAEAEAGQGLVPND